MCDIKQVIVIRKDLNLRKGKMAAQAAHASRMACKNASSPVVSYWEKTGQMKIVLGVDTGQNLDELYKDVNENSDLPNSIVKDHGNTEVNPGTKTAVAVGPASASEIDKYTGNLKLL